MIFFAARSFWDSSSGPFDRMITHIRPDDDDYNLSHTRQKTLETTPPSRIHRESRGRAQNEGIPLQYLFFRSPRTASLDTQLGQLSAPRHIHRFSERVTFWLSASSSDVVRIRTTRTRTASLLFSSPRLCGYEPRAKHEAFHSFRDRRGAL
ncbi:hypothetical protein BDN70DRAFT_232207 [Pholiota conissans]|uniref:Uncharacterized protein n=1 Tax=Pholiota conissans TaxID=109636 RepID=A0A9P5YXD9_9AGAR|nr:hypothetical protein BDN70DRAFT_232207 [Pholiota conissans]